MKQRESERYTWILDPVEGHFIERLNRFACMVSIAGHPTKVYLPNSGRLEELLRPDARVILEKRRDTGKTRHDLLLVETGAYPGAEPIWAALDSRLPPALLAWLIQQGLTNDLPIADELSTEPSVGSGRLDLKVSNIQGKHYIETKSVNLVDQNGVARFPDAPTIRGQRHLQELMELKAQGHGASLIFAIVRQDPTAMAPFLERDPDFGQRLVEASEAGVDIFALKFKAGASMQFVGSIPILLKPDPFPGYWPPIAQ